MPTVTRDKSPSRPTRTRGRTRTAEPESNGKLVLPSQENTPPEELSDSIIFFHGEKAIGKTSLAAEFPDTLVMMVERGRRNLPIFQVVPKNWDEVKGYVELFLEDDRFANLSIDTIDRLYIMCHDYVCHSHGVDNPDGSASPYLIWNEIAEEFGGLIYLIKQSGKGLILISHSKPRPLTIKRKGLKRDELDESVVNYDRMEPTCTPAAFKTVQEMADFVFYYGWKEGKRVMIVRSPLNIYWTACGVPDRFLDPDGTPLEAFEVGTSPKAAYKSLIDAYHNKLRDIDYTPPRPERKVSLSRPARRR